MSAEMKFYASVTAFTVGSLLFSGALVAACIVMEQTVAPCIEYVSTETIVRKHRKHKLVKIEGAASTFMCSCVEK